jgi:hypothetical protein
MTKFMVLYKSTTSAKEQMANATPEEAKAGMDAWMAWSAEAGNAIVDLGAPLQARSEVHSGSAVDNFSKASGYSILQADSVGDLTALLRKHPHLQMPGSSIEILEMLSMPGM